MNTITQNPLAMSATTPTTATMYPKPSMTANRTQPVSGPHPNVVPLFLVRRLAPQYAVHRIQLLNIPNTISGRNG